MLPATVHGVGVIIKLESGSEVTDAHTFMAAIESQCTILYRPLIVTFALSSTILEILPVLYAQSHCVSK